MKIKKEAARFYIKLKGNPNFLSVKQYYERKGWKIVYFTETSDVINLLDLHEKAKTEKAFIYHDEGVKYIFVNRELSAYEQRRAIFHEAGHIELRHEFSRLRSDAQERQADEFASALEDYSDKEYNPFAPLLKAAMVIIILFALLVHHTAETGTTAAFQESDTVHYVHTSEKIGNTDISNIAQNDVYVTRSGSKYHMQDCYYIRNNDNAYAVDIDDALKNYLPCSICIYEQ